MISLNSHPSKVMLKMILNRMKPQAGKIIAEEQADFRAGRSTTEQIFNLRILCEKSLQHQLDLYHVFIDFKKAFNRVWHAALWASMKKDNVSANLIRLTSAVFFNSSIETGTVQQLESDRDVYSHPPSSTYFWKRS